MSVVSRISQVLTFVGIVVTSKKKYKLLIFFVALMSVNSVLSRDCVVLLHGLARVSNSMGELEAKLTRADFFVANINYLSRKHHIDFLAHDAVSRGIQKCLEVKSKRIHFVTHSLGGILVRYFFEERNLQNLGRVVMLGPPNQGSELVDRLKSVPGFSLLGPTGMRLGTDADSILRELGPVSYEVGVIAGTRNITPFGFFFLDRPNDSVVTVESTKVQGMSDHISLPVTHTLMMRNNKVIDHSINFLRFGHFDRKE